MKLQPVIHHIEYMQFGRFTVKPSGEQFLEQRDSWGTSYKFTSKELDAETGLYYYGARYYNPNLSILVSVDPMSDKYPCQSNYMYCSGRPVNVIDPDGMDEWEVNPTGHMIWIKESKKHTLFVTDDNGNRTGKSLRMNNRDVFDQLTSSNKSDNVISKAVGNESSQNSMTKAFFFLANNTEVEWRMDRYNDGGKDGYSLGTIYDTEYSPSSESMGHSGSSVISWIHSHPKTNNTMKSEISSMGWWPNKNGTTSIAGDSYLKYNSNLKNSNYYVYFPNSGRLWSVRGNKMPAFIRNINSDYRRLFLGTLNTK